MFEYVFCVMKAHDHGAIFVRKEVFQEQKIGNQQLQMIMRESFIFWADLVSKNDIFQF